MVQGGLSLHQITTKSTAVRNLFIEENQNFTRNKNNWEFMMNDDRDDDVDETNQEEHPLLVSLPGQFLETTLTDKLSAGLHQIVIANL